jgi:glycine/sarcosine N-methyltransferase
LETLSSTEFYDRLAKAFDVMTDWQTRLAQEMPFLQRNLDEHTARTVLDTACGTGWHAITLAQKGYAAAGCDASPAMVERARANAAQAGLEVGFEVAGFASLSRFAEKFGAVLCLGNSLPHLLSQEELVSALQQMHERLIRSGVLILHNLNYDLRLKKKPRFFSANGSADTLVWRFADYGPEFITFHTALFQRNASEGGGEVASWSVQVNSTPQRPLLQQDLDGSLVRAGFTDIRHFGGLDGSAFHREESPDLVIVAEAR